MKLQVTINQNTPKTVETGAERGKIMVDGKSLTTEIFQQENNRFTVMADNRSIEVFVLKTDKETKRATLLVNGKKCTVSVTDEMDLLLKKLGMDTGSAKKMKELRAPMPGLVVKVEVAAGETVSKDQAIVILEAMKMENVLKAQADGIVQSIEVTQGQAVEKNQILIKFNS